LTDCAQAAVQLGFPCSASSSSFPRETFTEDRAFPHDDDDVKEAGNEIDDTSLWLFSSSWLIPM
jgi:hypothetical protein